MITPIIVYIKKKMNRVSLRFTCISCCITIIEGVKGVRLSKSIMDIAGKALKHNITTLGPLVLPISEHIGFFWNYFLRKTYLYRNLSPYVPDFHKAFQHFCIHTGGRAVIDALEKVLKLTEVSISVGYALRMG